MKPEDVRSGQVFKSRDGGSLFKVTEIDDDGRAWGTGLNGQNMRSIKVSRLIAPGRNGYDLMEAQ